MEGRPGEKSLSLNGGSSSSSRKDYEWEEALREIAGIKGWNIKDHGQDKLTALVLEEVFRKLRRPTQRNWRDDLVGVHDQMEAVMELLSQGTPGVRFVVIHDIRADNIISLQKKLLRDFYYIGRLDSMDADDGMDLIKEVFSDKKVILVLDDMDKRDQLMKLAGKSSWLWCPTVALDVVQNNLGTDNIVALRLARRA
ncbi:hypothetical protein NL676_033325 [Syzygium grande]|nr:hypothetical protein NL676_033325 [Syzygium grande]